MFHRLLGVVAVVGQRLSLVRINFIPLHLAAMIGLGVLASLGTKTYRDALVNDREPRQVTLAEVLDHVDTVHNFVAVKGTLIPEPLFQVTQKRSGREQVEASFLPLLDRDKPRALLVRHAGDFPPGKEARDAVVTGMLVSLDDKVRGELVRTGGKIQNVPFDLDYMLEENAKPGNAVAWGVTTAVATLLLLAMFVTWRWKYVVFRATGAPELQPAAAAAPEGAIALRLSGHLRLANHKRHFVDMPAMVVRDDDGQLLVLSNIDASSTFFGVKTTDRRGLWSAILDAGRLAEMETGDQYLGWQRRPALRLAAAEGAVVLSCFSAADRVQLQQELLRLGQPA